MQRPLGFYGIIEPLGHIHICDPFQTTVGERVWGAIIKIQSVMFQCNINGIKLDFMDSTELRHFSGRYGKYIRNVRNNSLMWTWMWSTWDEFYQYVTSRISLTLGHLQKKDRKCEHILTALCHRVLLRVGHLISRLLPSVYFIYDSSLLDLAL